MKRCHDFSGIPIDIRDHSDMCRGMAGMEDMDMPGLGVMPVEVNGEEMLMTEVTHGSHGSHGLFGIMGSGFQPEQAGLIVDPATQAPVGVSHPQGRTDSNSETAGKWLPCKRSTRDAAEVEPSDRRGQNVCPDNSTYDLHMTHFHLTNVHLSSPFHNPWHYGINFPRSQRSPRPGFRRWN